MEKLVVDSYYGIGEGHLICQDYALHGSLNDMEYVIVSDGCSGAEHSEVGAQILCHAAKYHIELCYQTDLFKSCSSETLSKVLGNSVLKRIDEIRKIYPINKSALEATLLIAIKTKSKLFIFGWGDGVIIKNYQSNKVIEITHLDYENKPFYLISDKEQYSAKWNKEHYKEKVLWGVKENNSITESKIRNRYFLLPFHEPHIYEHDLIDFKDVQLNSITICSDGILSFKDEKNNPVNLLTMVNEYMSFKTVVSGFVKKRMFFMKRKIKNNKWSYYDDISSGTILFNINERKD